MNLKIFILLFSTLIFPHTFAQGIDTQEEINKGVAKKSSLARNAFILEVHGIFVADFSGWGTRKEEVQLYFELEDTVLHPFVLLPKKPGKIGLISDSFSFLTASGPVFQEHEFPRKNFFPIFDGEGPGGPTNPFQPVSSKYDLSPLMNLPQSREEAELLPEKASIDHLNGLFKQGARIILKAEGKTIARFSLNDLTLKSKGKNGNAIVLKHPVLDLEKITKGEIKKQLAEESEKIFKGPNLPLSPFHKNITSGYELQLESKNNGYDSKILVRVRPAIVLNKSKYVDLKQKVLKKSIFN